MVLFYLNEAVHIGKERPTPFYRVLSEIEPIMVLELTIHCNTVSRALAVPIPKRVACTRSRRVDCFTPVIVDVVSSDWKTAPRRTLRRRRTKETAIRESDGDKREVVFFRFRPANRDSER